MPPAKHQHRESLLGEDFTPGIARRLRGSGAGFLTSLRHKADIGALIMLAALPAEAMEWHAIEDISGTAEAFVSDYIGATDERTSARAGYLDPRTQLPDCREPLSAELQAGARVRKRMMVRVSCAGARPWKIYVPVDVVVKESVVVAARTLPKGHLLTAEDLGTATRNVSTLQSGYATSEESYVGQRLKQSLIEGRVVTPAMIKSNPVIRRGQSVTITVRGKSLNIRMEGKALMDGAVNQRIRVENINSRRIVEGIVRSGEHVEVLIFEDSIGR